MAMTPPTTMTSTANSTGAVVQKLWRGSVVPPWVENMSNAPCTALGRRARMPMVITSETPLPMPRSVICSPIHIRSMVPAVITVTVTK